MPASEVTLIHDWNGSARAAFRAVEVQDETLRDGLQSASVRTPDIARRLRILHLMAAVGVDAVNIGFPGTGTKALRDAERLGREIVDQRLPLRPNCAARTVIKDIAAVAHLSQRLGRPIEVAAFIGSSQIRRFVEGWTVDEIAATAARAVAFAVAEGLPVCLVTEDTTRAEPVALRKIYAAGIRAGASRICLADTVGHATPEGTRGLVRFIRAVVDALGAPVAIDWHGHNDRGLALANALAAIAAGVHSVHATALGIGERVGNTPLETLLVNLVLLGSRDTPLHRLPDYCLAVAEACRHHIPNNHPIVGRDAFRTAVGVHAAAILKALHKNDPRSADLVYSSVPAALVSREQEIEIGPMSGRSNAIYWLERRGLPASAAAIDRILAAAQRADRILTDADLWPLATMDSPPAPARTARAAKSDLPTMSTDVPRTGHGPVTTP